MKVEPRGFPHELDVVCEHMHRYPNEQVGVKLRMDSKILAGTVKQGCNQLRWRTLWAEQVWGEKNCSSGLD